MNNDDQDTKYLVISFVIAFIIFLMIPDYMTKNPLSYGAIIPLAIAVLAVLSFFNNLLKK